MKIIPPTVQLSLPIFKRCTKCGQTKLTSDFCTARNQKSGLYPQCRQCRSQASKHHYQANREKVIARTAVYQRTHPDIRNAAAKKWRESHREQHVAACRVCVPIWRAKNRDKDRAAALRWIRNNPDRKRDNDRARRARKRNAVGRFSTAEWRALKARYNFTCLCCGKSEPAIKLVPDHVLPLSREGSNFISNIQPLCEWCNLSKHAKHIDYRPG